MLFRGTNHLYKDYPDEAYPGRVLKGELVLNDDLIKQSEANFKALISNRIRQDIFAVSTGK